MRRLKLVLPLAALILLLAIPATGTGSQNIPSSLTLRFLANPYGELMSGKVGSANAACKAKRTVELYRVKSGPDRLYATKKTNSAGRYRIAPKGQSSFPDGRYYTRAPRKALRTGHGCGGATSGKVKPISA